MSTAPDVARANGKAPAASKERGRGSARPLILVSEPTDAEYLRGLGLDAACLADGPGVAFRDVVVAYNPNDGYAAERATSAARYAAGGGAGSVRMLALEGPRLHTVAAIVAGRKLTSAGLAAELGRATPWRPPTKATRAENLPEFSNFVVEGEGRDERKRALTMFDLDASLRRVADGWPKRVGDVLFVEGEGRKPRYLKTPASLFAWLDRRCRVNWTKGASFISQERFFEDRRAEAEAFDVIEGLPHFPPAPGVYYMHEPIPEGDGSKLERLLDFFAPETPHDRQLIKALILTLFWGGPPGARPAFIIQGPKDDGERMGVGVGKSKGSQILAEELVGGYVSLDQREPDIEALKTRLLSNESGRKRVGLVDNLKTHKFSCGGLEGLITDSNLSGRALYSGEGARPNRMVWIFTVNGARVSKDIAERSIFVRLARPKYRPGWETEVRTFIRENRQAIMADVRLALESPGDEAFASRDAPIRWADWCREVLSKVEYPSSVVTLAAARQSEHDADSEGRAALIDHFRERLAERGHDPDTCKVLIPNAYAYTWVEEATRRKRDMDSVVGYLEGLAVPELRKGKSGPTRGWVWTGPQSERTYAERLANSAWAPK